MAKKNMIDFTSKEFIIILAVIFAALYLISSAPNPLEFKTAVNSQNIEFKGITLNPQWDTNHIEVHCSGETKVYQFTNLSEKGESGISPFFAIANYWPTFWRPVSYVSCENDNGAIILKINETDRSITYATVSYK